jgi:parallel beta-helix repeat protein
MVALAIGLALSLGLWGSWTASAQDTFIVNQDTGTGDPAPCDAPDFPSVSDIETVIENAGVQNGDTLVLCPGIYMAGAGGTVEVDKKLTIQGQETVGRDQIVIQVSVAGADGLAINTTGVTIRHLKVSGPAVASDNGISVNAGGATIEDVEVTGWGAGIDVSGTNDVTIQDSHIHGNEPDGIFLEYADNVRIAGNIIDGASPFAIRIDTADLVVVEDNAIAAGIPSDTMVVSGRSYVQVLRNTFTTRLFGTDSSGGIDLDLPAEALVIIGGSDANANTFDGNLEANPPVGFGYYVSLTCGSEATVNATHNYWKGSPVISRGVSGVIFNDEDDDPFNPGADCPGNDDGAVVFHPTASGPAPTPTPSPTPTATGTPTPTPTATATATPPGATRTIDLSPPGWHSLVWSGANATDPGTALACIAGKYNIAYAWEGPTAGFKRHVEGCAIPGICNMSPLNKYSAMLVSITAATTCQMPVVP